MQPFIQSKIKLTSQQLDLLNGWTASMGKDSKKFFVHVLMCHKQSRLKHDFDEWKGVPCPRKTFIHEYCREYQWDDVAPFMKRLPYIQEEGICFRYKIHEELIDDFVEAGQAQLLNVKQCMLGQYFDSEGKLLNKLIKPFNSQEPCQVDVQAAIWKLNHEKQKWEAETDQQVKSKLYRRWLHNLNCFQGIMERVVRVNYDKKYVWYSQELVQPDEGLRFYEMGGGLQCASSDFREYLLITSPVINVDVVKCHPNIVRQSMEDMGMKPVALIDMIEGNLYIEGCKLATKSIKKALCAVINGARRVYTLNAKYAIPKIVLEDPQVKPEERRNQLRILNNYLKKLEDEIKAWSKELPNHERIAKVSAFLQAKEVMQLKELKALQVNDQHDGALITSYKDIPQATNLQIIPKPISQGPQQFIPMEAIQGNFVDAIIAMGNRTVAQGGDPTFFYSPKKGLITPPTKPHTHKNTGGHQDSASDYDFQSLSGSSIL